MEAVRHLRAAGLNEPAERLENMAREMREQFERQQQESGRRDGDRQRGPRGGGELRELREQIQRLTHEVEKLRHEVRDDGPRPQ
jgi:DNA anti-recombination protein RmuC